MLRDYSGPNKWNKTLEEHDTNFVSILVAATQVLKKDKVSERLSSKHPDGVATRVSMCAERLICAHSFRR